FFDIFAKDTVKTHRLLQQGADPSARADMFLVFGAWTHGGIGETVQGEVSFPADAPYTALVADLAAFFGWCLKDGPRPDLPPVRYYRMRLGDDGRTANGEWLTAQAWPPPSTATTLYLHDDGSLSERAPVASETAAVLSSNPAQPIPSRGGGNLSTPAGPFDQGELDSRADVLTATTLPADQDVTLDGDVVARIHAASSTTDADVIVRLSQVTPSGRAMLLADGIRRGRFLGGSDAIRPLTPGTPALFEVEVGPVAFVLPRGHALRLSVQPSSSPRYEPNPGVAAALATNPGPQVHEVTLFRDPAMPSSVILPITTGSFPSPTGLDADAGSSSPDAAHAPDVSGEDAGADSVDVGTAMADAGGQPAPAANSGCGCAATTTALSTVPVLGLLASLRGRRRRL
ncbi:MAG: CocE/NonD family hydrolase, partial [Deltaproteobacteria bacterium]|nr:CocE/NonD family hydrolase [Deltaproteobacteria bacterium]